MIYTSQSFRFVRIGDLAIQLLLKRCFASLNYLFQLGNITSPRPILLIGNSHLDNDLEIAYHLNRKKWRQGFHAFVPAEKLRHNQKKFQVDWSRLLFKNQQINDDVFQSILTELESDPFPLVSLFFEETRSLSSENRFQCNAKFVRIVEYALEAGFDIWFYASIVEEKGVGKKDLYLNLEKGLDITDLLSLEGRYNEFFQRCLDNSGRFA